MQGEALALDVNEDGDGRASRICRRGLRRRLAVLLLAAGALPCLGGGMAHAGSAAGITWADFLRPSYTTLLEKAGAATSDSARMNRWAAQAAKSLSPLVDGGCSETRFANDFCGVQFATIPSTSMVPTLRELEVAAVLPYAANERPKRGDIIFFRTRTASAGDDVVMMARLIGLPGETVEISKGAVSVDSSSFSSRKTSETAVSLFGDEMTIWNEATPDGKTYLIAMSTDKSVDIADNVAAVSVPVGQYFVLGDNRHNSVDSRYPDQMGVKGFVVASEVIGRLAVIAASADPRRIGEVLR